MALPVTGPGFMGQLALLALRDPEAFVQTAAELGVPPPSAAGVAAPRGQIGQAMAPLNQGLDEIAMANARAEGILPPTLLPQFPQGQVPPIQEGGFVPSLPQPQAAQTPQAPQPQPAPAPAPTPTPTPTLAPAPEEPDPLNLIKALSALRSSKQELPRPPAPVAPPQGRGDGQGIALATLLQGLRNPGTIPTLGALIGGR